MVPSGVAVTPEEVDEYLAAQNGVGEVAVVAEMAAVINARDAELPEADTFLGAERVGGAATGNALYVSGPYDAIGFVRALLFEIATPRGYAVYDPQLTWLIDPAGRAEVHVTHGGAGEFPYLTESLAHLWVPELSGPNPYLIAERGEQVYIQTYRDPSGSYTVEYRDGAPERHFGATVEDPKRVAELFWTWAEGNELPDPGWSRVDF
nr:hypothetical protein [Nocardia bovistercoris]